MTDETSPEEDTTVSSASLCMSPNTSVTERGAPTPLCASTPLVHAHERTLTNGYDVDNKHVCDTINGNVNVNIVSESTNSMDVLSGGESDAGDTLSRRNNNSMLSCVTGTLRDGGGDAWRRRGDVTYFVAKELLMTERTYKRDLELVTVTWSRRVSGAAANAGGGACAGAGAGEAADAGADASAARAALARACLALEPLALPQGALLAKLERALTAHSPSGSDDNEEPEYKKIADLLNDYLSSTFDAYSAYTERSGTLVGVVESVRRRSPLAARECSALENAAPLPLACLLLRPLHRLLHYHRLATELYAATGSASARAAQQVSERGAAAALQQLRHVENHAALCQLQRDIAGYDKLLVPEREFIRLGCVYKHSSRGLQQRMFFLFSDVLLVASKCGGAQFRAHAALPLHTLTLARADLPHSFTITGDDVNLMVSASNEYEYVGWYDVLEAAIHCAHENPTDVDTELTPAEPDTASSWVGACGAAGAHGGALTHVCWHRATSLSREHLHLATRTQLSGYLLRKFKNSHGWQKLWVVFAVFTLFFYKSWQDETPLASLPLLGYTVGPPAESDAIHKDFVFKLQFKNHVYFFRADSHFTYSRWTEVLQTAMVHHGNR